KESGGDCGIQIGSKCFGLCSIIVSFPGMICGRSQAKLRTNGCGITALAILKLPCAKAIDVLGVECKRSCKNDTYCVNKPKISEKTVVPSKLKITCVKADRFAATEAPMDAKIAVIVVPILSPNNTGMVACRSMAPSANNPCKIPIVADELCTITVNVVPIKTPNIGLLLIFTVNS